MDKLIPEFIFQHYHNLEVNGSFEAVFLSIEILGLPLLVEKLVAENCKQTAINEILNKIFTPLVEIIENYRGEIIDFQDNQLLIIFPKDCIKVSSVISAALEIRNKIDDQRTFKTKFGSYYLDEIQAITFGLVSWEYFPELKSFYYLRSDAINYGRKLLSLAARREILIDPMYIELISTSGDQFQFIEKRESIMSIYYDSAPPRGNDDNLPPADLIFSNISEENKINQRYEQNEFKTYSNPAVNLAVWLSNPQLLGDDITRIVKYADHYKAELSYFRFFEQGVRLNLMFKINPENFQYDYPVKFLEDLKFINMNFKAGIALSYIIQYRVHCNGYQVRTNYGQCCRLTENFLDLSYPELDCHHHILTGQNYYLKIEKNYQLIELEPQVISDFARPIQLYGLIL
ncbi:MAG: hypothetical protein ACP5FK_12040 [bacterium]